MENNPLLIALKEDKLSEYFNSAWSVQQCKNDIIDLLDRQRQKCAEEAELKLHGIAGNYIDKESITNAKLI
jgi:hypothetical protein